LLLVSLLGVLAVFEARRAAASAPTVAREVPARLALGSDNVITLQLHNPGPRAVRGLLRDDTPEDGRAEREELAFALAPHTRERVLYRLTFARRGRVTFGDLHLRLEGPLGLGCAIVTLPAQQQARVYPSPLGPRRYELSARLGKLRHVGVRHVRRAGGGGELEYLREYVAGDSFRDLDWKATAKRARPVTRVYGQEQSQTVLLALDVGRMMAMQSGELTKLDHAIDAVLLLAWVALRSGDRVGLLLFAEQVHGFVAPGRGLAHYRRILDALVEVEARPTYVDFRRLSEALRLRVPRRALLVLFSDLLDESQAMPLAAEAPRLRGKHLPVCVTLSDPLATALADAPAPTPAEVFRRAAAADVLADRDAVKAHLAKAGVALVEAPAAELAAASVNRYLTIKAQHLL
jgi:uncharacterized protein (DUF58 family)